MTMIVEDDVRYVCESIEVVPTDDLILYVFREVDSESNNDPTGCWIEHVENLIYQYLNQRDLELNNE